MSGICAALCCWKSKDPAPYSPTDKDPDPVYHAVNNTGPQAVPTGTSSTTKGGSRTSYNSFTPPPSSDRSRISKSVTPDSAYGDGDTYQGTLTTSSPGKSNYGALSTQDYV